MTQRATGKAPWHFCAKHFGARPFLYRGPGPPGNIEVMRPMYEPRTWAFLLVLTTTTFLLTLVGAGLKITLEAYSAPTDDTSEDLLDWVTRLFSVTIAAACGVVACVLVAARRVPPADAPTTEAAYDTLS